jgi:c-di-GMP-binding flagellar brake protein YcgR
MAGLDFLKENQRIEIEVSLEGKKEKFQSRIEEIGEKTMNISSPTYKGELVSLHPGRTLIVYVYAQEGIFRFGTKVLDRRSEKNIPILVLSKPESLQKVQRRNFFRLKTSLEIEYRILSEPTAFSQQPFKKTQAKDISGGGVLLLMDIPLQKNNYLELIIHLEKWGEINCVGKVVFVKESKDTTKKQKEIALEFILIEEPDREKIIKFIFEKQRQQRYKELRWVDTISS